MISVLLIILKIVGITVLVIVGAILLILLLILFVPVRYQFSGSYEDTFRCKGKVTWLLHFISFRLKVEEMVVKDLRILGIPSSIFKRKNKDRRADKRSLDISDESDVKDKSDKTTSIATDTLVTDNSVTDNSVTGIGKDSSITDGFFTGSLEDMVESKTDEDNTEKKTFFRKFSGKVHEIINKIKGIYQKIIEFIEKSKDFIVNVKSKKKTLNRYLKTLKSETFKEAFSLCKKQVYGILKHIFPGKMKVNITYGLEDPANTGYILGVYGMLPAFIGERVMLHPDFNNTVFRGDFYLKGRIRGYTILHSVLRMITDKNCKKLVHIVKKEMANERK